MVDLSKFTSKMCKCMCLSSTIKQFWLGLSVLIHEFTGKPPTMLTFFALASSFSLLVENQVNFSCSSGD